MAATRATARAELKVLLNIPAATTTWDAELDTHLDRAVANLWPMAQAPAAVDTTVTVAADTDTFTLPAALYGIDTMFADIGTASTSSWRRIPRGEYTLHGRTVRLDTTKYGSYNIKIYGTTKYVLHVSDSAQTTLPDEYLWTVLCWAASYFYVGLAGNKRKYNIYVGSAGAAADRDMKDSAEYMKDQGDEHLAARVRLRGA